MNSRAIGIALIALFALCFVGSGAVAVLTLLGKVADAPAEESAPLPDSPPEAAADDEPPEIARVDPGTLSDEEAADEATDEAAEAKGAPAYEAPRFATAQFAVFHSEGPKLAPQVALAKAARGTRLKVYKDRAPPSAAPPYVTLRQLPVDDYAVIGGQTLDSGRGLTPAQKAALPKTKKVSVIDVVLPPQPAQLEEVARVMAAFAQATGGVLWDEQAQEYLALSAWKERRVDSWEKGVPQGPLNYTVFVDTVDKGVELQTAGLRHFGLPELELTAISRSSRDAAVAVINAVGQTLLERPTLAEPGRVTVDLNKLKHGEERAVLQARALANAQQRVEIELVPGGTGKVPTLAVVFPGEGSPTERVERGIASLFGSNDAVEKIEHDAALTRLSGEQMEIYKKTIKRRFRKGLGYGEVLLVKAPFKTSAGGNEWMWVEVTALGAGGKVEGLLANDPDDVPELTSGSEVVVQETELFDWMVKEADGGTTGNETGKVMLKRLGR